MFSFTLAFLQAINSFILHFQPLSTFCRKRKTEFGRKHLQRKPLRPQLLHVLDVECQIDCFACLAFSV